MYDNDRVMVFIDGSNLFYALKTHAAGRRLDMGKFAQRLARDGRLMRAYYYAVRTEENTPFLYAIAEKSRIQVVEGRLYETPNGRVEKCVDSQLIVHMLQLSYQNAYDTAILVSGDIDFLPAVHAVQNMGKSVEIAIFRGGSSAELRQVCDGVITLDDDYLAECWLSPSDRGGERRYGYQGLPDIEDEEEEELEEA